MRSEASSSSRAVIRSSVPGKATVADGDVRTWAAKQAVSVSPESSAGLKAIPSVVPVSRRLHGG